MYYICERNALTTYYMYKMHVIDIFAALFIRKIVLTNIAKIKRLQKKTVYSNSYNSEV